MIIDHFASNVMRTAPVFSAEPIQISLLSNPDEFFEKLLELIKKVGGIVKSCSLLFISIIPHDILNT
jgi:hypothetical protein